MRRTIETDQKAAEGFVVYLGLNEIAGSILITDYVTNLDAQIIDVDVASKVDFEAFESGREWRNASSQIRGRDILNFDDLILAVWQPSV